MPGNFSYLSILNPGFTAPASTSQWTKAGEFAYVSFLNPPGTAGGTVTTTAAPGTIYFFANANNVIFGTSGSTVTASASYSHVAADRAQAWSELGAFVGTTSPGPGVVYSDWLAGSAGYWMWIRIP